MGKYKASLSGTRQVFSFTLTQMCKSRGNLVSLVILLVLMVVSMPAMTFFQQRTGGGEETESDLPALVNLVDESDLSLTSAVKQLPEWSGVTLVPEEEAEAQATVTGSLPAYTITVTGSASGDALRALEESLRQAVENLRLQAAGLTAEQLAILDGGLQIHTPQTDDAAVDEEPIVVDVDDDMSNFWLQYGYSIAVMILCLMSASYVIRAVIEEKSSRLVELLLVSMEPMALLLGKVLAAMVYVLGLLAVLAAGWGISLAVTAAIFGGEAVTSITSGIAGLIPLIQEQGVWAVAVVLISLTLGYLTMSLLGGLSGASCSQMEEMNAASGAVMTLTMAGYLASCVVSALPGKGVALLSTLCPVLSLFCAPVQYLKGAVSLPWLLVSWLIQLVLVVALAWLSGRVYARLIIYNGKRLNWRQILTMARGGKEGA